MTRKTATMMKPVIRYLRGAVGELPGGQRRAPGDQESGELPGDRYNLAYR
jgi:hypothetical protein